MAVVDTMHTSDRFHRTIYPSERTAGSDKYTVTFFYCPRDYKARQGNRRLRGQGSAQVQRRRFVRETELVLGYEAQDRSSARVFCSFTDTVALMLYSRVRVHSLILTNFLKDFDALRQRRCENQPAKSVRI